MAIDCSLDLRKEELWTVSVLALFSEEVTEDTILILTEIKMSFNLESLKEGTFKMASWMALDKNCSRMGISTSVSLKMVFLKEEVYFATLQNKIGLVATSRKEISLTCSNTTTKEERSDSRK